MKWVILCAVVVAALATPFEVKRTVRDVSASNTTGTSTGNSTGNATLSSGCGVADLDLIQAQVITTLTDEVAKLIGGTSSKLSRRSSGSEAGASSSSSNGQSQSAAFAKSSADKDAAPAAGSMRAGSQVNNATLQSNNSTKGNSSSGIPAAPAPAAGHVVVQNAAAHANMDNGTAISTVSTRNKRDSAASVTAQKAQASGGQAVAGAESHSGTDVTSQKVDAVGGHLGVATAVSNGTGNSSFTSQQVNSSGNQAISTAQNTNKGNAAQTAAAKGGDIAVAQVSNSAGKSRRARSVCAPVEMTDKIRALIKTTVEQAFEDVKKQMKLD